MLHMWYKYRYIVLSRVRMHSFLTVIGTLEINKCEAPLLEQRLTHTTSVTLTVPLLKKSDFKEQGNASMRKLPSSMQYSPETITIIPFLKGCSVALFFLQSSN